MKKKMIAVLLACILTAGTAAGPAGIVTVRAEEEQGQVTEDGFAYDIFSEGIFITGYTGNETEIVIPESIDGEEVVGIDTYAFQDCSSLTSISIPSGVTQIGGYAFSGCSNLTSINIPSGVTQIEYAAFSGCSSLTSISILSSWVQMHPGIFAGTPWLDEQLRQNGGIIVVNDIVVYTDKNISGDVVIPSGVKSIGDQAFSGRAGMTSVRIPEGVTSIGFQAFASCRMKSINLPFGVTSIGRGAFYACGPLKSINIPSSVTSIENEAFAWCGFTSISIPSSVTQIGDRAFMSCSALKDLYYAGSQEQWEQLVYYYLDKSYDFKSVTIHYNSAGPANSDSETETVKKSVQTVTANDITKTYGEKAFSLGAISSGGAVLTYAVSDPKVATVDGSGNVTIKSCGITDITITAAETSVYAQAQKTIKLTVKPKKMTAGSVKSKKKKTVTVKWKKDKNASGYLVECATDKKFKKNKVKVTVSKNKTVSATVKKLKAGKKYYVRICAYVKSGNIKVQGDWSKAKTVKVKKY